jgi:hypothetical protein
LGEGDGTGESTGVGVTVGAPDGVEDARTAEGSLDPNVHAERTSVEASAPMTGLIIRVILPSSSEQVARGPSGYVPKPNGERDGPTPGARPFGPKPRLRGVPLEAQGKNEPSAHGRDERGGNMDGAMLMATGLVGACTGYLIGLLVMGTFVERGGRGGGGGLKDPDPDDSPTGSLHDFDLWEAEMAGSGVSGG